MRAEVFDDHLRIDHGRAVARYREKVRFGFGADLHYARRSSTREYLSDGKAKLTQATSLWNAENVDFVVMCGDYTDSDEDSRHDDAIADLIAIEEVFDQCRAPRHYAYGNQDLDRLTKADLLDHSAASRFFYSFDVSGIHFVILDPNYFDFDDDAHYAAGQFSYLDTWINPAQLDWLSDDLARTELPTIVFSHQRLARQGWHFIENSDAVRSILATAPHVKAVFTGHSHENEDIIVDGIHHFCMDAMVTGGLNSNAFSTVHVYEGDYVVVHGYGRQASYLRRLGLHAG